MSNEAVFNKFKTADALAMAQQNLIVNGNMDISQENGGVVSNTSLYYLADQWFMTLNGGHNCNTYQSAFGTDHFDYSGAIVVKVANAAPNTASIIFYTQQIEGTFSKKLAWGTTSALPVTYGFWAYCSDAVTFCPSIRNGGDNRSYITEHTIGTADTWEFHTGVIPGDTTGTWYSNTSVGLDFSVTLSCGTDFQNTASSWHAENAIATSGISNFGGLAAGNTFHLTGAFLLPGAHSISAEQSKYIQRPYDDELRKCQRYYTKMRVVGSGVTYGSNQISRICFTTPTSIRIGGGVTIGNTAALQIYDGDNARTINEIGTIYTDAHSLSFDANLTINHTSSGRSAQLYSAGTNYLTIDARM